MPVKYTFKPISLLVAEAIGIPEATEMSKANDKDVTKDDENDDLVFSESDVAEPPPWPAQLTGSAAARKEDGRLSKLTASPTRLSPPRSGL